MAQKLKNVPKRRQRPVLVPDLKKVQGSGSSASQLSALPSHQMAILGWISLSGQKLHPGPDESFVEMNIFYFKLGKYALSGVKTFWAKKILSQFSILF